MQCRGLPDCTGCSVCMFDEDMQHALCVAFVVHMITHFLPSLSIKLPVNCLQANALMVKVMAMTCT